MKKQYDKNPLVFALIWIGIYCAVQSLGNMISDRIGIYESANAVLAEAQTVFLLLWLHKYDLMKAFGLNKPTQSGKRMLFYIPLILVCTRNLWNGWSMNLKPAELCFHIVLMLVETGRYYSVPVLWAIDRNIVKGITPKLFMPDNICTRAEIVTFLWRAKDMPAADGHLAFDDVETGHFYSPAVLWAVKNHIAQEERPTEFCPDGSCLRAQIVTFLYRARQK